MGVLLTPQETAEQLRISVATLRSLRQQGKFARAIKIGRRVCWDPEDLDAWLRRQKEPS